MTFAFGAKGSLINSQLSHLMRFNHLSNSKLILYEGID